MLREWPLHATTEQARNDALLRKDVDDQERKTSDHHLGEDQVPVEVELIRADERVETKWHRRLIRARLQEERI